MIALASSVWKSLWDVENTLRSGAGWLLSDLIAEYDGPTLNEGFCTDDAVVKYIDIVPGPRPRSVRRSIQGSCPRYGALNQRRPSCDWQPAGCDRCWYEG